MTELTSIILAAGEGTRMRSALPKVLHRVGGLPLISHVMRAAQAAGAGEIVVVVGPNHDDIRSVVAKAAPAAAVVEQADRLGTGHAVREARAAFADARGNIVVVYGDTPLVTSATIVTIAAKLDAGADLVVVGFEPEDPTGYGRLLTAGSQLIAIREHKDATEEERAVRLCNSGIMGFKAATLRAVIGRIENKNAKGEFYLTDAVELANIDDLRVEFTLVDAKEVIGVDDRAKQALAEGYFQDAKRREHLAAGVTLHDPATAYFSWDTEIGRDVTIEPSVWFGPGVTVEEGATIRAFSHIEGASIGAGATVGPFARLRPGADLGEGAKVGNFVEVKQATIGKGAKVSHLTYVGDAEIGASANIGAGTVTVNYDGINKHRTVVGDGAFIGSNSSLIAPVNVGAGAYVTAGSVISHDVEPDAVAFGRARQENKTGYAPKLKARAEAAKRARSGK